MSIIIPVDIYLLKHIISVGTKLNYSDRCSHLDHTVTPSLHVIAASQLLVMTIMPAPAGTTDQCGDQVRSPLLQTPACCRLLLRSHDHASFSWISLDHIYHVSKASSESRLASCFFLFFLSAKAVVSQSVSQLVNLENGKER